MMTELNLSPVWVMEQKKSEVGSWNPELSPLLVEMIQVERWNPSSQRSPIVIVGLPCWKGSEKWYELNFQRQDLEQNEGELKSL